jgi:DTW domain-containing protein YfiP
MNVAQYKLNQAERLAREPKYRVICEACDQPDFCCYCAQISAFDPLISFVILIHPIEVKRRIATGRMSHLSLKNSYLIEGQDYTHNSKVNALLEDKDYHSVVLYPGINSQNLSIMNQREKTAVFPREKRLRIFVVDGTWATARKMMRLSENLKTLPRVCFSPDKPSNFRVRKQPHPQCYSTIEAIHHTIELVGDSQGFAVKNRLHDRLLRVFEYMVERQLQFIKVSKEMSLTGNYRKKN